MADEKHEPVAPLSEREQFFYDHAGYSFKPGEETREQGKRRCALALAAAEQRLTDGPFFVTVERDPDPMDGKSDEPQWIVGLFTVTGASEPMCLGSMGAVDCPADDPYLRVVAADLADELIPVATTGTVDDGAPNVQGDESTHRPDNPRDAQDAITDAITNAMHVLNGDDLALADILREAMDSAERHYRDEPKRATGGDATSPLPEPPAELADAWRRFQGGGAGDVTGYELRALDEWRADCAQDAGF